MKFFIFILIVGFSVSLRLSSIHAITGSENNPLPGSSAIGASDASKIVKVIIFLRCNVGVGAISDDIAVVLQFAAQYGLAVVTINQPGCFVKLSGNVTQLNQAFNVTLTDYNIPSGTYHSHSGPINIPLELANVVVAVVGLDNRRAANHNWSFPQKIPPPPPPPLPTFYLPAQIAKFYNFPTGVNGAGQCVAIIELGGGYYPTDLMNSSLVTSVSVDGGTNSPSGNIDSDDMEVALDIQVVQGVAPGTKIVVYFAPNTNAAFLEAIMVASINNTSCGNNSLRAVSISWGASEDGYPTSFLTAMDMAFQNAVAHNVVVTVAAGDQGSSNGQRGTNVQFPASSPNVLGCGGTTITVSGTVITNEVVWNNNIGTSGGGVSTFFAIPTWQKGFVNYKFRGVPDVSGNADPDTGYILKYNGVVLSNEGIGGTSAVAPLWSGLISLMSQGLGKSVSKLNQRIYNITSTYNALRGITQGNNGAYSAGIPWNACTGLGSPNGTNLMAALH